MFDSHEQLCVTEIVETEGVMGGQPRVDGHRISVLQIAEWVLEEGMPPETVSTEFGLSLADVYRALTYYYDHVDEMEQYRSRRRERIEESRERSPDPDSVSETV